VTPAQVDRYSCEDIARMTKRLGEVVEGFGFEGDDVEAMRALLDELRDARALAIVATTFADHRSPTIGDLRVLRDGVRAYRARRGEI
jgi:hypothetical protein